MRGAIKSRMRGRLGVAALVVVGALAVAGPAEASPLWLPPQEVSTVGDLGAPTLAVDPAGDATVGWNREETFEASEKSGTSPGQGPGSAWSTPVTVGSGAGGTLVTDAAGNVTSAWREKGNRSGAVKASTKPAGGTWEAPVTVASSESIQVGGPRLAATPSGEVVAIWSATISSGQGLKSLEVARKPAGGTWEAPVRLSVSKTPGELFNQIQIATDASGDEVAAWASVGESGKRTAYFAATRPAGGSWSEPAQIVAPPAGGKIEQLQLAVDPSGDALVAFRGTAPEGGTSKVIEAASMTAGGTWEAPVQISPAGRQAGQPTVAFDSEGNATAAWVVRPNGSTAVLQTATKPAGGSWSAPESLTGAALGQYVEGPRLAIGPGDDAILAFERKNGPKAIETVARAAGGAWEAPIAISAPAAGVVDTEPAVGVDSEGAGIVAWSALNAAGSAQIEAATSTQTDEPPFILAPPTVAPTVFYVDTTQRTATISIEAGDDRPLTNVRAIVTAAGGGETEVPLPAAGGNLFKGSFTVPANTSTEAKTYSVEVIVEDSGGQTVSASAGTIRSEPKGVFEPKALTVEPGILKFGPASLSGGETVVRTIALRNLSSPIGSPPITGVLHLTDPQFSFPEGAAGELPFSVPPRGEMSIELAFHPSGLGQRSGELKIARTDGRQPALKVSLFGTGVR
jgi:microcompartment protein CcmK/EutM